MGSGPWFVPYYYVAPCDPLTDPWCYHPIVGAEFLSRNPGWMATIAGSRPPGSMSPVGAELGSFGSDTTALLNGLTAEDPLWVQLDEAFNNATSDKSSRFSPFTQGTFDAEGARKLSELYDGFTNDFMAWRTFFNGYLQAGPEWFGLTSQEDQIARLNQWKERRLAWAKDFQQLTNTTLPGATRMKQPVDNPDKTPFWKPYAVGAGIAAAGLVVLSVLSRRI